MEELANHMKEVRKLHRNQFNQLDLNMETAPRDSRYSQQLLEMMKKEELLLNKEPSSSATRAMTAKVDEGLKNETQAFFCKLVTQNTRKWEQLKEKLARVRAQLNNEITVKQQQNVNSDLNSVRLSAIDAEEDRLLADYYKNWLQYEGFHLNQAFQSQQSRIDNDWATHEKSLHNEFTAKRVSVVGTGHIENNYEDMNKVDDNRWQHPEKQKTLIHTAPVFTPVRPASGRKVSGLRKKDNHNNLEVSIETTPFFHVINHTNSAAFVCMVAGENRKGIQGGYGIITITKGGCEALAY